MLNPTKKNGGWKIIEAEMTNGVFPPVYINHTGDFCLDNGSTGPVLPAKLAAMLPSEIREAAAAKAAEVAKAKATEQEAWLAKLAAERAALDARSDEPGFMLLAGENTDVIARGTLRECRDNLWKVTRCRRDSYSGMGCWIILDSAGVEVEAGKFSKHGMI